MNFSKLNLYTFIALMSMPSLLLGQSGSAALVRQEPRAMTRRDWSEDLDYLVKRLEIMHPNLYANVSREKFIGRIEELKQNCSNADAMTMIVEIMALVALVRDGHTGVDPGPTSDPWISDLVNLYPMRLYPFADGLFVLSATRPYSSLVGKKIVKVGDVPTAEAITRLNRFINADNETGVLNALPGRMVVKELLEYAGIKDKGSLLPLVLQDQGGAQTQMQPSAEPMMAIYPKLGLQVFPVASQDVVTMDEACKEPLPLWLSHPGDKYWFKLLQDKRMYLQINEMYNKKDEHFNRFCERLFKEIDDNKVGHLIIDLRLNNGGNHIELPLLKGILARPHLDKPDRLFVLTSRVTFSASQHLTTLLARYTNVTIIGEPTAGKPNHFGAIRRFKLPHSGLGICSSVVYHQDGQPQDFTVTTKPDLSALLTSDDYKNRRDPALQAALAYDGLKIFRTDVSAKMMAALKTGGIDGLKQTYKSLKPDVERLGFSPETLLYKDLDAWMMANSPNKEMYIEYLRFMLEEIPDSITICFDLGSWLETRDREEAKKCFRRCLELNPAHKDARLKLALMDLKS